MSDMSSKRKEGGIRAVIDSICGSGKKRYAVTRLRDPSKIKNLKRGESITFSLQAWQGRAEPQPGQVVILHEVQEFSRGWRAASAEPVRLH